MDFFFIEFGCFIVVMDIWKKVSLIWDSYFCCSRENDDIVNDIVIVYKGYSGFSEMFFIWVVICGYVLVKEGGLDKGFVVSFDMNVVGSEMGDVIVVDVDF